MNNTTKLQSLDIRLQQCKRNLAAAVARARTAEERAERLAGELARCNEIIEANDIVVFSEQAE